METAALITSLAYHRKTEASNRSRGSKRNTWPWIQLMMIALTTTTATANCAKKKVGKRYFSLMFAVIAAFGLTMATVAVLPQAHAIIVRLHQSCEVMQVITTENQIIRVDENERDKASKPIFFLFFHFIYKA